MKNYMPFESSGCELLIVLIKIWQFHIMSGCLKHSGVSMHLFSLSFLSFARLLNDCLHSSLVCWSTIGRVVLKIIQSERGMFLLYSDVKIWWDRSDNCYQKFKTYNFIVNFHLEKNMFSSRFLYHKREKFLMNSTWSLLNLAAI